MITFKFEQNISHEELMNIARSRINEGYQTVIANRGEEQVGIYDQVAYLVSGEQPEKKLLSKQSIAEEISTHLESQELKNYQNNTWHKQFRFSVNNA